MQPANVSMTNAIKGLLIFFTLVVAILLILPPSRISSSAKTRTPQINSGVNPQTTTEPPATDNTALVAQDENACATCHESIAKSFGRNIHGKALGRAGSPASCQSCHGDGAEHMSSGGDISKIKNPAKLKPAEASNTCLTCHAQMKEHAMWRGSKHESAGLSCLSCHSSHHSPVAQETDIRLFASAQSETKMLKMRTEADTCYQCHSNVRKSQFQRSTHLFRNEDRQNRMNCSSCHEPHGSIGPKMMRTASVNETCYQCHTEKRGPFLWEHAPSRENCASCHKAHGSTNTALLVTRAPMLCQQCHIQGRHQTVPGVSNSSFAFNRACLNCHSQVHGSNHPSGINLQR